VFAYAVFGGMKGMTYTQVAQYCVLITAYTIPAIFISLQLTGNPIPGLGLFAQGGRCPLVRRLGAGVHRAALPDGPGRGRHGPSEHHRPRFWPEWHASGERWLKPIQEERPDWIRNLGEDRTSEVRRQERRRPDPVLQRKLGRDDSGLLRPTAA
jgi:hypothetical protein